MLAIGVDTGGTFTDFVYTDGQRWGVHKRLSTPDDPARAVLAGLKEIAGRGPVHIVHGSTVATNAILERTGVKTALVTNRGFEDVIEIGRQNRSRLYDLAYRKAPPLVPRRLRIGLHERTLCDGRVLYDLNDDKVADAVRRLTAAGAESVAVCLLFSYLNPDHEKRIGDHLQRAGFPVSLSHAILAEFREFERTATTVLNAYVSPRMHAYVSRIRDALQPGDRLRVMQSNGGSISAQTAMTESVRTILSGPAGGAVGAHAIGRVAGYDRIISFDMGGTSTDVSLMDGGLAVTLESTIGGYPVKVPMIDIHTVGAGGGSIAALDPGGALTVGPASAGADPGPICCGRGKHITVTDAHLFLGRLVPERFLGGGMRLHADRLEPHFNRLAARTKLTPREVAAGILTVANTAMEKAIRVISVEKGHDPREFTLLAFGGAGGLHAVDLARLLGIPTVLVPANPGTLSAFGMLTADIVKDYSLTVMLRQADVVPADLDRRFADLERGARSDLIAEGAPADGIVCECCLDMRYHGQSYEIIVPFGNDYLEGFHALHEKTYGYRNPDKPVEIVNLRLRARGTQATPKLETVPRGPRTTPAAAVVGQQAVCFDAHSVPTPIVDRGRLVGGNAVDGPAIVVEYSATIVIPPMARAVVDAWGNLVITVG